MALFLGSFGDEAAQVAFALRLANGDPAAPAQVSALLAAGLIGGIGAGAVAPRVIVSLGARRTINTVLMAESVLIAVASIANMLWWYVAVAAALGCLGSMLWSAVMVALPALDVDGAGIDRSSRVIQSVRNLGYVVGPLLGSVLFAWSSSTRSLLALALLMLVSAGGVATSLPGLVPAGIGKEVPHDGRRIADVRGLLRTPGVLRAIAPLVVTVLMTSALNVLLIVRVRIELDLSAGLYGVVVAALSVGLVIGPVLFAGTAGRLGEAAGASVAAAVIGVGIIGTGAAQVLWQLMAASAVVGVANGVQNALMASFVIGRVDPARRAFQMPAYVLILQTTVFTGFVGAAFIHVDAAGTALVVVGAVAVVAGSFGAFVNRSDRQQQLSRKGVSR